VMKNGQLEVNTSGRTYETYLSGSISFSFGSLQTGSLEVNGFHFIDSAPLGQIRILGGNVKKTVNLRISNNLFNCYTYGATNSGSALVGNSALQKTGSIEDNYFHLTQVPTYENDSGAVLNYGNRAITLRNMRGITINSNYFNGYTGDKIRPIWLASEVSDGNTTAGYGNLALTGNRFENSTNGTIYINNIRDDTEANVLIAGNSYGGEKLTVTFNETASQISQNLPTDKSKIAFSVQTEDLPHLNILPKADSGVSVKEFQYYVTFRNDKGHAVFGHSIVTGTSAPYTGPTPTKATDASGRYAFQEWVDVDGKSLDLNNITATTDAYASFTKTAHTPVVSGEAEPTCTEPGYTGDTDCTVCGHRIETGTVIPATGHTAVTDKGTPATCTEGGLSDGSHCKVCKVVLTVQEPMAPLGHAYEAVVTTVPTFTATGVRTFTCKHNASHTYTEAVDALSKSLYFTFDNDGASEARYNNFVYNFQNFDTVEAWRGRTTGYKEGSANLDPTAGILTVSPGVTGFTSIFADSVNFDLNYDPEYAKCFQIRFKANGFTGDSFKAGIYFYYSTDNSYMSSGSVVVDAELLKDGEYFVAEADLPDRVRNLDEVNRIVVYLSGFDTATDLMGTFSLDYVYAGPYETLPSNPMEDSKLKLSHSLNLASDISVNLAVAKTTLAGFDMSTVYVESVIETYAGNEKTGTTTVRITPVEQGNFYYFTLTGLTAVNMNDRIVSTLYGTKNGQSYASPVDDYSISDYAYAQLNKTTVPNKLKTLCADLLRYGAKAQVYKNYRTDFPADSKMTEDHKAYLSPIEAVVFGSTNVTLNDLENAPIVWAGKALNLESKVALKFMFKLGTYTGSLSDLTLRVSYEDVGGNIKSATIRSPELYSEVMGIYVFTVDTLLAAELRSVVSVQIYAGNAPVSCTLQYSADTYGNNKTGKLLELCKALFAYCDSAKAYFAN
ncbi:MAG: hypothetical protein IKM59_02715, partial [Oscillospiraceae bacterium]|nr:hypothetical protein [Oscillospiraceae bacterium]